MILLDYNSLLISLGLCSAGLGITFFVSWLVSQTDRVLITWGIGAWFIVAGVLFYSEFVRQFSPMGGILGFSMLLVGMVIFWGGAHQFSTGTVPLKKLALIALTPIALISTPMLLGYDGICYIVFNFVVATLFFAIAWEYGRSHADAPLLIRTISGLYVVTGLSFLLCAVPLLGERSWIMRHAPTNWAESINMIVSLTAIAGIGALSLALNQARVARRHERAAEVDPLTGLFNRRALVSRNADRQASIVVVVFDIDHFKEVNDIHGHHTGDAVLQAFSRILLDVIREGDLAARLGGEEFAVLLPHASLKTAFIVAERVRKRLAGRRFRSEAGYFNRTVSAGISLIGDNTQLDTLIIQADAALYTAKRSGRDRVVLFSDGPAATQLEIDLYNIAAKTLRRPSLRKHRT
jgi:diguanylate cyclase (GGDEF)-like protein